MGALYTTFRDIESGTKMVFFQATAPTGWTIVNTGLTDAAGNGRMICAVHSNQYAADGGSQNPASMTTPTQTTRGASYAFIDASSGALCHTAITGDYVRYSGGGGSNAYLVNCAVNAVTLTPYYRYCIVATKD